MILKKRRLAAAAAAGLTGAVSAAGPQQEDELWWLTGGSGEHSQADPEEPGEAYDGPSTVHNEEGFFVKQEDETGHGTWNSLTEKGLWVGGDGDDTGFRVDNDGNVATTGNADIDGTLSASNDKFTVDEKGNLHAKNENARIDLDEAGAYLQSNTTYMGVTDGAATIASGASRVQVTEDGAVFETPDGKTSIKGNAVETGKVTAEKGDIGGVWMADRNVSNVDKITAEKGDIGDVYLKDGTITAAGGQFIVDEAGKVTASKGDIGGVWMADRNVSNVDKITAEKGDIGNVYLKDGTISAAGGQFTVDETGKVTAEKGDVGDVWMADGNVTAASIQNRDGSFKADADGNVTAASGAFSGSVTAETGTIGGVTMTGGGIIAANDNFVVNGETGTFRAAGNKFHVYGSGDVTADGTLTAGAVKTDSGADLDEVAANLGTLDDAAVKWDDGDKNSVNGVTLDNGGITAEGQSVVGGVTMNEGRISAANGAFRVDNGGAVTAGSVKAGSVATTSGADLDTVAKDLDTLDEEAVKWDADSENTVNGVKLADGGISAANNQFYVNGETGAFYAANQKFHVSGDGAVTAASVTAGTVATTGGADLDTVADELEALNGTAVKAGEDGSINGVFLNDGKIGTVNGNFHVDEDGSITAAGAGTIGGVSLSNGTVAAQDVTITLAANGREAETVSMNDMWDAMSGGTMTVGGISYGGSYFYTSGTNTPHLSIGGGRYDVNMNHFGQIMDAVEGVGVDTVTDAIDGLKKDEAGSGTASGTSAAGNEGFRKRRGSGSRRERSAGEARRGILFDGSGRDAEPPLGRNGRRRPDGHGCRSGS